MRGSRALRALLPATALSLAIGCGSDTLRDLLTIGIDVDIERQTVPGLILLCDDLGQALPGLAPPLTIRLADEEELQGEGIIGEFESVVLEHIDLQIVDVPAGDSDDWDFLDSVRMFAQISGRPDTRVLVAELDPVPQNVASIRIPGTRVEIQDIASEDDFIVSGEVTGRIPCDEVHFEGEADFEVELFD